MNTDDMPHEATTIKTLHDTAANKSSYKTKREIAAHFNVSRSTIERWTRHQLIPVIRPSSRKNLYHLRRCEEALAKFEIGEVLS